MLLLLASCYKDYDIYKQAEGKNYIVINGFLERDSSFILSIGKSDLPSKLTPEDGNIDVDSIKIYKFIDNNDKVLIEMAKNFHSPYNSQCKGVQGAQYYIEVFAIGKKASVVNRIPDTVGINSINITDIRVDTFSQGKINSANINFILSVNFTDPDTENYYIISGYYISPVFYLDTSTYQYTDSLLGIRPEPINFDYADIQQIHNLMRMYMPPRFAGMGFSDALFNGQNYTMRLRANISLNYTSELLTTYPMLPLLIELITIDKAMYKHAETKIKYYRTLYNPFMEPVNVYSNVRGGFGLVGALNRVRKVKLLNIRQLLTINK